MNKIRVIIVWLIGVIPLAAGAQQIIASEKTASSFLLTNAAIYADANDFELVKKSAVLLQSDIEMVTGKKIPVINTIEKKYTTLIAIGSISNSVFIKQLIAKKQLNVSAVSGKWEGYTIQSVSSVKSMHILALAGNDRRGTAYAVMELSKQIGVSPWYWWADVPVKKLNNLYVKENTLITDAPKVKYRGIFINDEAPALSNWSKSTFGGFNHLFYAKVFELMLRLKSNYIWPAMWGNAFYDDDSLNIKTADEYGIVIGTSHHEPLMRAHDEWRRYANKKLWNYDSSANDLKAFWRYGMQRATNEKIVSVGMRGDGDAPMSRETATSLLEKIVQDQRSIIEDVTGKKADQTPQLWALYKEVQDYYDKGMRVPDDVTLLLCDDNWGNIRRLPQLDEKPRKGGYGIYYHFDYVGGPRNYKWLNTNPIPRVWEQMHLAYEYNVKNIWIVNVGDIKPMEFPISFFLDYAWNPEKIGADDLTKYTEQWSAAQFGCEHAKEIAAIISTYTKYNGRRKPELLDDNTYSTDNAIYNEFKNSVDSYKKLLQQAEEINQQLPMQYKDAYFQLVLHPVKACSNLMEMYFAAKLNELAYRKKSAIANDFAYKVKELFIKDSLISLQYHRLNNGKWNHMMDQTHIGYTYWQQPPVNKMPPVKFLSADSILPQTSEEFHSLKRSIVPANATGNVFYEEEQSGVSAEAAHYTKAVNANGITWKILPDLGRTGDAITTFPVTAAAQQPAAGSPHLEYEFYTYSKGEFKINAFFSPTLNFQNSVTGLQYAISVDDETPQILSVNKEDNTGVWNKWVADNIIIKMSLHKISASGKHTVKYWMVNSGLVLQKLVLDFGGVKQTYLGPPETINKK